MCVLAAQAQAQASGLFKGIRQHLPTVLVEPPWLAPAPGAATQLAVSALANAQHTHIAARQNFTAMGFTDPSTDHYLQPSGAWITQQVRDSAAQPMGQGGPELIMNICNKEWS